MALMRGQIKEFKELIKRNLDYLPIILLHGSNTFHIKEKCDEIVDLVCGPTGKIEMRVQKTTETNLLKSPDDLKILIKTSSFFPGKQVWLLNKFRFIWYKKLWQPSPKPYQNQGDLDETQD